MLSGITLTRQAEQLKAQANKAFAAKDFTEATKLYSDAIALDPTNHVLFSNRSAAKAGAKDYQGALEDADKVGLLASEVLANDSASNSTQSSPKASLARAQLCTDCASTQRPCRRTRRVSRPMPTRTS